MQINLLTKADLSKIAYKTSLGGPATGTGNNTSHLAEQQQQEEEEDNSLSAEVTMKRARPMKMANFLVRPAMRHTGPIHGSLSLLVATS